MDFTQGTRLAFTYSAERSGIVRERDVVVAEIKETGKGTRLIAYPMDSASGRDGVRTFTPARMENVRVTGWVDVDTLS